VHEKNATSQWQITYINTRQPFFLNHAATDPRAFDLLLLSSFFFFFLTRTKSLVMASIPTTTKLVFLLFSHVVGMASAQLSSTFYDTSCPKALSTIKSAVASAVKTEARMGASLLRLHFHDCFVNASHCSHFLLLQYIYLIC
jgi:hypothetical protein